MTSSRVRIRVLQTHSGKALETPCPILFTIRGQLPYLPGALISLPPNENNGNYTFALQLPLSDWASSSSHRGKSPTFIAANHPNGHGIYSLASLPRSAVTFISVRAAGAPTVHCTRSGSLVLHTRGAAMLVSAETSREVAQALCADVYEICSGKGRGKKGRSMEMNGLDVDALSVVHGVANAKAFALTGFYNGESAEKRWEMIEKITAEKNVEDLFILPGNAGAHAHALLAVGKGVALVETDAPFAAAARGEAFDSRRGVRIVLRDARWKRDSDALVNGCECPVCGGYAHVKKGYVKHLLETHEMMGNTILARHNVWDYMQWWKDVREAVRHGRFEEFKKEFFQRREALFAQCQRGVLPL